MEIGDKQILVEIAIRSYFKAMLYYTQGSYYTIIPCAIAFANIVIARELFKTLRLYLLPKPRPLLRIGRD